MAAHVADPVGRFVVAPTHIVWCHSRSLCGAVNWGRPSEEDVRRLLATWQFIRHPALGARITVLMDNHALEHADARVLPALLRGMRQIAPT